MNIIIGQYIPTSSHIHRLDPRTKLTIVFFFVIVVFFANNIWSYSILSLFTICMMYLTKIKFRFILKGLWPIWFLIVFTFVLHLIVTKEGTVLFKVFIFEIYSGGVLQGIAISMRFILLILAINGT